VVAVVAVAGRESDSEGPGRRGDDGIVAWARPGPSEDAELVVAGETICSTSERELFCVEAATGDEVFSEQLPAPATAPTLAADTLVVGADGGAGHGDLYGYSLDGQLLWEAGEIQVFDVDASVSVLRPRMPAVGNIVAVPTGGAITPEVAGVDARSGREVWRARGIGHIGPVLSDGERFYLYTLSPLPVSVTPDDLRNLDPADPLDADILAILEEYAAVDPANPLDPRNPEDLQFMLDTGLLELINAELSFRMGPQVVALDPASGAELWRAEIGAGDPAGTAGDPASDSTFGLETVAAIPDSGAVAFTLAGEPPELLALDAASGARRWGQPLAGDSATLAHIDGTTIVVDGTDMRGLDADGTELWRVPTPGQGRDDPFAPHLVVADGRVYAFRNGLFTVDPADGTSQMLRSGGVRNVAVADDHLIVASAGLEAVRLPG
jgi:outer membrane protein assembly factor BamB